MRENARKRGVEILHPVREFDFQDWIGKRRFPVRHQPVMLTDVPNEISEIKVRSRDFQ